MVGVIQAIPFDCFFFLLSEKLMKIGSIQTYAKNVSGEVYVKNETTLVIKDLWYNGAGPLTFFMIGSSHPLQPPQPSKDGTVIPYPYEGEFFDYHDADAKSKILPAFNGEEIELTMPHGVTTAEIKWLSVWCFEFHMNFGDIFFPEDISCKYKKELLHPKLFNIGSKILSYVDLFGGKW